MARVAVLLLDRGGFELAQSNQSWIKLHTEMLYDPKMLRLHPIGRFAWIGLLLMARAGDPPGTWQARSREAVPEDLACVLRLDDAFDDGEMMGHVASAVVEWERSKMVTICNEGLVTVTHWNKRQGDLRPSSHPEAVLARVRKHRGLRDVTRCNAVKRDVTTEENRVEEIRVEEISPPTPPALQPTARSNRSRAAVEEAPVCQTCVELLGLLEAAQVFFAPGEALFRQVHQAHESAGAERSIAAVRGQVRKHESGQIPKRFLAPKILFDPRNWQVSVNAVGDTDRGESTEPLRL